jgi:hypothetical protein
MNTLAPIDHESADALAQKIIRTMTKYANFRTYWRHTQRQDVILANISKTIQDHFETLDAGLKWEE